MLQEAIEPDRLQGISWTAYQNLSDVMDFIPDDNECNLPTEPPCPLFVLHPGKLKIHSDHVLGKEDPVEPVQKVDPGLSKPPAVTSSEEPVKWVPDTWCSFPLPKGLPLETTDVNKILKKTKRRPKQV